MLNRGLTLAGSPVSFDSIKNTIIGTSIVSSSSTASIVNGVQEINMNVDSGGYSPNSFVIKTGVPVKWNVNVLELTGCNQELVMREYNIDKKLERGLNVIEFTPTKTGTISFTCGMGMLHGSFVVTQDGSATQQQLAVAKPAASSSCGCGGMK
jgi:plastocyanin domain-containing protein